MGKKIIDFNNDRGNRKAQQIRRRKRLKNLPQKQKVSHELIDGNSTFYPVGFCKAHRGFLSLGLFETHRCRTRSCQHFTILNNE